MKILRKPKTLPIKCSLCGAVFKPKWKDVRSKGVPITLYAFCPFCGKMCNVHVEKEAQE